MNTPVESFYRKREGLIQILALFFIPAMIAIVGIFITLSIERTKTRQEYVRIACGILSQKIDEKTDSAAMRSWAADVLQEFSPIPMTKEQRDSLISGDSLLQGWGEWGGGSSAYSYTPIFSDESKSKSNAADKKANPK